MVPDVIPTGIVVQKYGGSSVADAEKIKLVAQRIARTKAAGKKVVVVVSAMGKTTNQLIEKAKSISASPSRRELDMLLTCGEREAMSLLSMACAEEGLEAISFTGSQAGILTNDRHSGARIVEVRPFRIEDELDRGKVVIVAGFQGVSYKREITTLGRGGSDTTAVALAGALRADYCEICCDVDGVYTADPRDRRRRRAARVDQPRRDARARRAGREGAARRRRSSSRARAASRCTRARRTRTAAARASTSRPSASARSPRSPARTR